MNLQHMISMGIDPCAIQAALRRRFNVVTRENGCRVWPYSIVAYDDDGRVRLRIAYLWSERLWRWAYCIIPGDRL